MAHRPRRLPHDHRVRRRAERRRAQPRVPGLQRERGRGDDRHVGRSHGRAACGRALRDLRRLALAPGGPGRADRRHDDARQRHARGVQHAPDRLLQRQSQRPAGHHSLPDVHHERRRGVSRDAPPRTWRLRPPDGQPLLHPARRHEHRGGYGLPRLPGRAEEGRLPRHVPRGRRLFVLRRQHLRRQRQQHDGRGPDHHERRHGSREQREEPVAQPREYARDEHARPRIRRHASEQQPHHGLGELGLSRRCVLRRRHLPACAHREYNHLSALPFARLSRRERPHGRPLASERLRRNEEPLDDDLADVRARPRPARGRAGRRHHLHGQGYNRDMEHVRQRHLHGRHPRAGRRTLPDRRRRRHAVCGGLRARHDRQQLQRHEHDRQPHARHGRRNRTRHD